MSPENFCFWAQGFFELSGAKSINEQQVQIFKDHLTLVFKKETPHYPQSDNSYDLGSYSYKPSSPFIRNTGAYDLPYLSGTGKIPYVYENFGHKGYITC